MIKDVDTFIKEHSDINYCEAIILKDGRIVDSVPSHIYKLVELTGKTKSEINELMPMFASPLDWLVSYTEYVAVWYDSFKFHILTDEQRCSLQKLVNSGVLYSYIEGIYTDEYNRCKSIQDYNNGLMDNTHIKSEERIVIIKEL